MQAYPPDGQRSDTKGTPFVVCEDLFKIYKIADLEVVALRGLDLVVDRGEVAAIVGASGSGKSTLLNILAGYDSPSAGGVSVGERDLLRMSSKDKEVYRKEEVGFIWQQTSRNLFPYLSAMQNVALPMMLRNLSTSERAERAEGLLRLVGLSGRLDHTPARLSGGEQQRAAIAVALANQPRLLLADEPTGELDDTTAGEILDLFGAVNMQLDITIVIVTHDTQIAHKVGRVVTIRDGKTSTEIRSRATSAKPDAISAGGKSLEEYTLVDKAGRVQIPRDYLDRLKIGERAQVRLKDGRLTIEAREEQN